MVNFVKLGDFLYKRRRLLGYTQETVAAIIGISDRTLRNIEYGQTVTDIETILSLYDLYSLPLDELSTFYSRDDVMKELAKIYDNIKPKKVSEDE